MPIAYTLAFSLADLRKFARARYATERCGVEFAARPLTGNAAKQLVDAGAAAARKLFEPLVFVIGHANGECAHAATDSTGVSENAATSRLSSVSKVPP